MRKLYLILNKRNNFVAKGNSSKSAWRSLYWVHYHIGHHDLSEYRIMTLYSDGKTEINSANEVLHTLPSYKKTVNKAIEKEFGFKCDLDSLVSLYNAGCLSPSIIHDVTKFLARYKKS